ncbi:hypothetical protein NL533_31900, partial [Klebsiella pneumoniae]|nr:hypothetical protein [Klebsiella pneumoniae]
RLVTLKDDVPLPEPLAALAKRQPDRGRLKAFLEAQAFRSLLARLDLAESGQPLPAAAAATPPPLTLEPAAAGLPLPAQGQLDLGLPAD